jgi:hypothetical protein
MCYLLCLCVFLKTFLLLLWHTKKGGGGYDEACVTVVLTSKMGDYKGGLKMNLALQLSWQQKREIIRGRGIKWTLCCSSSDIKKRENKGRGIRWTLCYICSDIKKKGGDSKREGHQVNLVLQLFWHKKKKEGNKGRGIRWTLCYICFDIKKKGR